MSKYFHVWQREVILLAGLVEVSVVDGDLSLAIYLFDWNEIGQPGSVL